MSLIRQIAYNTGVQISGKLLSTALGIAAIMIMTRTLGAEQFGWYATATGFLQFVGLFSDFGFTVTTSNMLSEPRFDKTRLLNTIFSWRLLTALIFNGLAPFIFLFLPYPAELKYAVFTLSLSFFAIALSQIFFGYYQAKLRAGTLVVGEIFGRTALVIGTALVAYFGLGLMPIIWLISGAAILNLIYLWSNAPAVRLCFDREISRALYTKIWPNASAVLLNSFYLQGDRVILPMFVAQTTVGLYSAAYRVLDIIIQISALTMGLLMPLITTAYMSGDRLEFQKRCNLSLNLTALITLPMLAGGMALAEPIMRFVGGAEFGASGPILRVLMLAVFGVCLGMVFGHINLAINRQRQALWIYGSDALLSIIGYFIFIPRYGITGALTVTIFSQIYAGILLMALAYRAGKLSLNFLPLTKIILASALMAGALYFTPPYNLAIKILIGIAVYGASVVALEIISWETVKAILAKSPVVIKPANEV
ncbi:MAG: hypothetical protein A3J93_04935 [Candidatus Magasanikbacteria bacterium RIFOXYC2_FULL_42_28]|uniref:Uncharacterized protein n=1 Tax=Candidatus Magasanikbacteria bacterium RIFOXYC2_FULL_42_28 TaxID=1798704 RepID=A0A1F6NWX3_9BACT|nr:MAG: hypothetical protein A3J93_04935 [Candidatus Magasanikbacteria bacterium RIFOXYC2_FULL_42_28]